MPNPASKNKSRSLRKMLVIQRQTVVEDARHGSLRKMLLVQRQTVVEDARHSRHVYAGTVLESAWPLWALHLSCCEIRSMLKELF